MTDPSDRPEALLQRARQLMREGLARTALGDLCTDPASLLGNGKLLRAAFLCHVGPANGVAPDTLARLAAATEMIHAASLLHDDVIDGGQLRRGAPAFWVERGIPGALLFGDLLLIRALDLVAGAGPAHLLHKLIQLTGEVCQAEAEQELLQRGRTATWEACVSIARRKTGPLFAFAGYAAGGEDAARAAALEGSGYDIGTAYQLADDILDVTGDPQWAGKSLGRDRQRAKATTATAPLPQVRAMIGDLCARAVDRLQPWPGARQAAADFITRALSPVLERNAGGVPHPLPA